MFPWNKQFPFNQSDFTTQLNKMNPKEVENYIQSVMKNVFGGDFTQSFPFQGELSKQVQTENSPKQTPPELFETNEFVYVKLPISEKNVGSIKIQHTNNQLIINNESKKADQTTKYTLPSPVKRKGTKARYVDGFLEIQLIKLKEHSISEVDITY